MVIPVCHASASAKVTLDYDIYLSIGLESCGRLETNVCLPDLFNVFEKNKEI